MGLNNSNKTCKRLRNKRLEMYKILQYLFSNVHIVHSALCVCNAWSLAFKKMVCYCFPLNLKCVISCRQRSPPALKLLLDQLSKPTMSQLEENFLSFAAFSVNIFFYICGFFWFCSSAVLPDPQHH